MPALRPTPLELRPVADVAVEDGRFVALGREPWLEARPLQAFHRGAVVEICYAMGLSDRMARPILQFRARDGRCWNAFLPAPSEGAACWRGRVPPETVAIRICPTDEPGPFQFRIESVRALSSREKMRLRFASPRRGLIATGARMVRLREEADLNLRFVLERAETQAFEKWRARRRRAGPLGSATAGQVAVVISGAVDPADVEGACAALLAQTHADWRLVLSGASAAAAAWAGAHPDPRISDVAPHGRAAYVMALCAGDRLAPHALASFLAAFARHPEYAIVYSDDTRPTRPDGGAQPHFKPDWSPIRQAYSPYVGRAAMLRAGIAQAGRDDATATPQARVDAALADAPAGTVGHVARALVATADSAPLSARMSRKAAPKPSTRKVTIVIPTRDRIDLLSRCLTSIFARTGHRDYDVVVIDNGSVEPATLTTLERLQREEKRLSVIRNPMPFNFAALCNFGAAQARGDTLLFLNNDTVVLQPRWIERMLEFATRPDVGAVGCKLVYPEGRVQHAGIVLGMGGVAGHFGEGQGRRAAGWLGGSLAPHECSAVTAACLMVEGAKFHAVGGFDADNLPIELNDVDLCLRLNARGWRTICDCRVMLAHRESASRGGAGLRLQRVHRPERDYFLRVWGAAVRNDPYFNPNLSLYDREPKLG